MYNIIFYEGRDGSSGVADLLKELREKTDILKDAKISFCKIVTYLDLLSERGTVMGEPVLKYLRDGIWRLGPLRNRTLFASYQKDGFIILYHFIKKTQKTPARKTRRAKADLRDFEKRNGR